MFEAESENKSTRNEVLDAEYLPTHDYLTARIPPYYPSPPTSLTSRQNAFTTFSAFHPHRFLHYSIPFAIHHPIVTILHEDDVKIQTA